jgi:hypothetical protein
VFSDVWGPAQTSVSGHKYYVSFIDAYSRFTWLYLIKRKSDVFSIFTQFQTHVERLLKHKIIHVQSDWGASIATSTLSFRSLGFLIVYHALILISRMVPLSVSIGISLKLVLPFWPMHLSPLDSGVMLFLPLAFSSIVLLLVC